MYHRALGFLWCGNQRCYQLGHVRRGHGHYSFVWRRCRDSEIGMEVVSREKTSMLLTGPAAFMGKRTDEVVGGLLEGR